MCKVPDGDLPLLLDVREEGAFVIYFEGEDAVLVGSGEGCGVEGGVAWRRGGESGGRGRRGVRLSRWKGESMVNSNCKASLGGRWKGR